MAKKTSNLVSPNDLKVGLIENLTEFSKLKSVDRSTLMSVLEEVFRAMIRRRYGSDDNFDIIVNPDKGDIQAFRRREVVEDAEIEDETRQITLSDALLQDPDSEVGDSLAEIMSFDDFGRRHILTAKQLLANKITELENTLTYNRYKEMIGEILIGEVYQIWKNEILVLHEGNELSLPRSEQIPRDRYKKGDTIRAVVLQVEFRNAKPAVTLSRTAPAFLAKLFEQEVPEIYDGLITIRKIVREPGERAKVAVESYDDRIDPVGACVGVRGSRIHGIVKELQQENIDVINFSNNIQVFIQRAITPAKPSNIIIDEKRKHAAVYLRPDQVSLAIGKNGINVKLASRLTEYEIDVYREVDPNEEDVELDEFSDEIEPTVIEALKRIGCDSAKSVMQLSVSELERRTGLEARLLEQVLEILRREFEEESENPADA
jgi:N utilization substance protein A